MALNQVQSGGVEMNCVATRSDGSIVRRAMVLPLGVSDLRVWVESLDSNVVYGIDLNTGSLSLVLATGGLETTVGDIWLVSDTRLERCVGDGTRDTALKHMGFEQE